MTTGWSELGPDFLSTGSWSVGQGPGAPDRQLFRALLDAAPPNKHVLEVGFGPGIDAESIFDGGLLDGGTYTGIDATPELVARAVEKYGDCGTFEVADICTWTPTTPYSVVYARHVLEHVSDGEEALRRLWRATRGILILSWFIRPTWTPSEVGCVIGDGFEHHTYSAPRWIELASSLGAHLSRYDFDHHLNRASVWILARQPQPELAQVAHAFTQSPEFLAALLPVPSRANEPYESALDDMEDAHDALSAVIPILERVPELERLADESHRVAAQVEAFLFPTQDEPEVSEVIRPTRELKSRCEALAHWAVDDRVAESQAVRDAARVLETRLREAGRL